MEEAAPDAQGAEQPAVGPDGRFDSSRGETPSVLASGYDYCSLSDGARDSPDSFLFCDSDEDSVFNADSFLETKSAPETLYEPPETPPKIVITAYTGYGAKRIKKITRKLNIAARLGRFCERPPEALQDPPFPLFLPDGVAHCPPYGRYVQDPPTMSVMRSEILFTKIAPETRVLSQRTYQDISFTPDLVRSNLDTSMFSGASLDFGMIWNNFLSAFPGHITASQTFLACCLFIKLNRDIIWGPLRTHFAMHLAILAQTGRISSLDACSLMCYLDNDPEVVRELDPLLKFWPESLIQFLTDTRVNEEEDEMGEFEGGPREPPKPAWELGDAWRPWW